MRKKKTMGDEDLKEIPDIGRKEPGKGSVGRTAACTFAAAFCLLVCNAH